MNRRGMVLPIVVVCACLLGVLVLSFHFVSMSDYRAMGRLYRATQAGMLADLASDEIASMVGQIRYGPSDPKPAWVTSLLTQLASARGTQPPWKVSSPVNFSASDLPVTQQAIASTAWLVELKGIEGRLGPFVPTDPAATADTVIYKEALYGDGSGKDLKAWDVRGPLAVKVSLAGTRAPFDFTQEFLRGQDLCIVDTTAPAGEFVTFSFLPPPTPEYAINDLQAGGKLQIDPKTSGNDCARMAFRGPLFVLPEDPPASATQPNSPWLSYYGDKVKPLSGNKPPPSYPDGDWVESQLAAGAGTMATVPGPRALVHTDGTGNNPDSALTGASQVFELGGEDRSPRRPAYPESQSHLKTKDYTFNVTVNIPNNPTLSAAVNAVGGVRAGVPLVDWNLGPISVAISNNFDSDNATFDTIDRDNACYYPPGAYLYGPLASGQQKLVVEPDMPCLTRTTVRGVKLPALAGQDPAKWDGTAGQEGDVIVNEPVPRKDRPASANAGLVGLYGVALFESKTIVAVPIKEFALWMMQKFIDENRDKWFMTLTIPGTGGMTGVQIAEANKDSAADQTLTRLGLAQTLKFVIRRFRVEGKAYWPSVSSGSGLDANDVKNRVSAKELFIAPYGSWYHDKSFWSQVPQAVKDEVKKALKTASYTGTNLAQVFDELLPGKNKPPSFSTVDPGWAVDSMPPAPTAATKFRDWLFDDYARKLLGALLGTTGSTPDAALATLLGLVRPNAPGIVPFDPGSGKRPKGILGDYLAPPAATTVDLQKITQDYPGGYFPPKYRTWEAIATRRYATMADYVNAEARNGALELRGAVLIEKMQFTQDLTYRGRGLVICGTTDKQQPATLSGKVAPAQGDATSLLTLVHRTSPELLKTGDAPPIKLGSQFKGSVYSDSGVTSASGTTTIYGNLVAGLLNRGNQPASNVVRVEYDRARLDAPADKIADRWTVDMTGEVSSTQPTP